MPDYFDVLAELHESRRPRTYLEVGVFRGESLRLVREDTLCVGVDPEPLLAPDGERHCHVEVTTSDTFFAGPRPRQLFGGLPIDMIFIDGMHLFEYALRDFFNAEELAGRESLIVVHDCLPLDAVTASRERTTEHWTGDVWKLMLCLLDHRPDLDISIIDVPPSGVCLIKGLNPTDRALRDAYDALVEQYLPMGFEVWETRLPDVLQRTTRNVDSLVWSLRREIARLHVRLDESETRAAALDRQLLEVYASSSWRLSAPIRRVGGVLRGRHEA
jgi:hypothetical protein